MTDPTGERLLEFLQVMRQLRVECDWKASQTHRSLVRYLLEEAHETAEAIESGDPGHLREELGDLLLQIWFHAVIAEESGDFTLDDVVTDIIAKMRRRNPHVFGAAAGDAARLDAATINEVWESIKAQEKQRSSPVDGLPTSLPALLYADKVLDRLDRRARQDGAPFLHLGAPQLHLGGDRRTVAGGGGGGQGGGAGPRAGAPRRRTTAAVGHLTNPARRPIGAPIR